MVELKIFKFKDKESYELLKPALSGWCFFRNEKNVYYIKAPNNKRIKQFLELGLIINI
jgi:hypothetical protein